MTFLQELHVSVAVAAPKRETVRVEMMLQDLLSLNLQSFIDVFSTSLEDPSMLCPKLYHANVSMYHLHFVNIFSLVGLKATPASENGKNVAWKNDNMTFMIEFAVNESAEAAFAKIREYKSKYIHDGRDVVCLGVNYRFVGADTVSMQDRLVCDWMAELYFENGTLKNFIPRQEDVYKRYVAQDLMKTQRVPVTVYYEIHELIAKGDNSVVYACRAKRNGHSFAAKYKFIRWPTHVTKEKIFVEIDVMRILKRHPNLLALYDVFEDEDAVVLIVEL